MIRALLRMLAILGAGCAVGLGHALVARLPWVPNATQIEQEQRARTQARERKQRRAELRARAAVPLDEFLALAARGALVIDARDIAAFERGHFAAPAIVNMPASVIEENVELFAPERLGGLPILIYCQSQGCDAADRVYEAIERRWRYRDMRIYLPGWEDMVKAGVPATTAPETWAGLGVPTSAEAPSEPTRAAVTKAASRPDRTSEREGGE